MACAVNLQISVVFLVYQKGCKIVASLVYLQLAVVFVYQRAYRIVSYPVDLHFLQFIVYLRGCRMVDYPVYLKISIVILCI